KPRRRAGGEPPPVSPFRMSQLGQAIILGLLIGGVYALLASGLTLIFGVMDVINVAQGALLILAAFLAWTLWHDAGIDPLVCGGFPTAAVLGVGFVHPQPAR